METCEQLPRAAVLIGTDCGETKVEQPDGFQTHTSAVCFFFGH